MIGKIVRTALLVGMALVLAACELGGESGRERRRGRAARGTGQQGRADRLATGAGRPPKAGSRPLHQRPVAGLARVKERGSG